MGDEITAADERKIRRFLGIDKIGAIETAVGRIIPAPVYFNDREDYWATIESVSYETQYEIEKTNIRFCSFYLKGFEDIDGPAHSPLVGLTYEIYIFAEYDLERSDEDNVTPDAFNKKMLKANDDFVAMVLQLKSAFQGLISMGIDFDGGADRYAIQRTSPLKQTAFIDNRANCRFIPGVRGYQTTFDEEVQLQLAAC